MTTTLTPKFLKEAAANPNGEAEAQLEELAFQAYNGAYSDEGMKAVVKALWFAYCAREKFVPKC